MDSVWALRLEVQSKTSLLPLGRRHPDIEEEIGAELEWEEKGRRNAELYRALADPEDRQDWNRQHQWLCEQLEIFHKVFSPRVKGLDATDYVPEEEETDE